MLELFLVGTALCSLGTVGWLQHRLPRWPSILIAAATLPVALWLSCVGIDLWLLIEKQSDPKVMLGLSIYILPICACCFVAGIAVIWVVDFIRRDERGDGAG